MGRRRSGLAGIDERLPRAGYRRGSHQARRSSSGWKVGMGKNRISVDFPATPSIIPDAARQEFSRSVNGNAE